jgi:hypothetical protein
VQRKPSIGGLTKSLGLGKKVTAAAAAEKVASKAGAANVSGAKDVEKQLARLEAATADVVKAHAAFKAKHPTPGVQDQENELAAFAVKKAAERILGPGGSSKAAQLLGGATPEQAQRLRKVIDDNQAIYGVVKADSVATAGEKAAGAARKANIRTIGDLEEQVSTLRSATMKLRDAHKLAGNAENQMAALQIKRAAERILGNMPKRGSDPAQALGPSLPEQLRWLQWVINENQLIYDEVRVEMTKRQADNIYLEAGAKGGFKALTSDARSAGFAFADGKRPDDVFQHGRHGAYKARANRAAELGLSPADLASITTFTLRDYEYINPATAHAPGWMKKNYADVVDLAMDAKSAPSMDQWAEIQDSLAEGGQTLDQRTAARKGRLRDLQSEGSLHAGMLMRALNKLPAWSGSLFRGEHLDAALFASQFVELANGDVQHKSGSITRTSVTSMSTEFSVGRRFSKGGAGRAVIYEFSVTNGRDIQEVSGVGGENEITVLPGATFAIQSVEKSSDDQGEFLVVKATQTK